MSQQVNPQAKTKSEQQYFDRLVENLGEPTRYSEGYIRRYLQPSARPVFPLEYIHSLFRDCEGQSVCDFGCGCGYNAIFAAYRGARVVGFDISPVSLFYTRRLAEVNGVADRVHVARMDATQVALCDGSFDVVLCDSIFHHVEIASAVAEARRLVRPGGLLIILEPIALSPMLQMLRRAAPVRAHGSPGEAPLTPAQVDEILSLLPGAELTYFRIFSRIDRLGLGPRVNTLAYRLDRFLMNILPPMQRFASRVVIAVRL